MQVNIMRIGLAALLAASAITLLNISATAQGFGGGQMPPEIQAKMGRNISEIPGGGVVKFLLG